MNTLNWEHMIAYLLHKLPEAERDAFEDRWMDDPELYEQLQDAEAELLDAYAAGTLSAGDRELVRKHLLGSPAQERKLLFARKLHLAFPKPARTTSWRGLAAAAVIVVLAGAASWLGWENVTFQKRLAKTGESQPSAAKVYVAEIPSNTTSRSAASSLVEVRLPPGAEMLRVDLQLEAGDEAQVFSASLVQDGSVVWEEQPIRAERRSFGFVAPVWVPAAALGAGEYQVKLSAGGAMVDSYRYRVI